MKCRDCGTDNPDDATLCVKCGSTLPTVAGPTTLIPAMTFRISPWVVGFVGFFVIVAGAWMIGDRLGSEVGAGVFLALLGVVIVTVALVVTLVYAMLPEKRKGV